MSEKVFIAIPNYKEAIHSGILSSMLHASQRGAIHTLHAPSTAIWVSQLNKIWVKALESRKAGVTHLFILHSDVVVVSPNWLDFLLDEMREIKVDLLSSVCRIKEEDSDAISVAVETSSGDKRLTLRDIPFGITLIRDDLLVNNGCLLIDIRGKWVEDIYWEMKNGIINNKVYCESEDWLFCKKARKLGVKIAATNKIKVEHWGLVPFRSYPKET